MPIDLGSSRYKKLGGMIPFDILQPFQGLRLKKP